MDLPVEMPVFCWNVGADVPLLVKIYPAVPAAVVANAVVELAYVTPHWVKALDCPVPPAVLGKVPVVNALVEVA
jgi:hypothetical protein